MLYQAIDLHAVVHASAGYSSEHAVGAINGSDVSSEFASVSIQVKCFCKCKYLPKTAAENSLQCWIAFKALIYMKNE